MKRLYFPTYNEGLSKISLTYNNYFSFLLKIITQKRNLFLTDPLQLIKSASFRATFELVHPRGARGK